MLYLNNAVYNMPVLHPQASHTGLIFSLETSKSWNYIRPGGEANKDNYSSLFWHLAMVAV